MGGYRDIADRQIVCFGLCTLKLVISRGWGFHSRNGFGMKELWSRCIGLGNRYWAGGKVQEGYGISHDSSSSMEILK